MVFEGHVEINPNIMVGKPVIKGTRIPVYLILNSLGQGQTMDQIINEYPDLEKEDILAALRFASYFTQFEELEETPS